MDTSRIQAAAVKMGPERQLASWHHKGRSAVMDEIGRVMAYRRAKAELPTLREVLALGEQAVKEAEADLKKKRAVLPKLEKTLAAVQKEKENLEKRRQEDRALMRPPMLSGSAASDVAPVHGPAVEIIDYLDEVKGPPQARTRTQRAVALAVQGAERNLRRANEAASFAEKRLKQVAKWTRTIGRKVTHFEGLDRPETPTLIQLLEVTG